MAGGMVADREQQVEPAVAREDEADAAQGFLGGEAGLAEQRVPVLFTKAGGKTAEQAKQAASRRGQALRAQLTVRSSAAVR